MYKPEMIIIRHKRLLFALLFVAVLPGTVSATTLTRDSVMVEISRYIWHNHFDSAITDAEAVIASEPANPLGYFVLGTLYQTVSEEFRTDIYRDTIAALLDRAIDMADDLKDTDSDTPDWWFIAGAARGYRAIHRAFHGDWWGAFRDGLSLTKNFKRALKIDSTFYDAYLGIGAYHYYRTIKAKNFLWLPFFSDQREQGIREVKIAIEHGTLASFNARESLLRIYFEEGRYDDVCLLADSLAPLNPEDTYCLLYHARSLAALGKIDDALGKARKLTRNWKKSKYYDPIGMFEAELVTAEIFIADGDLASARKIIDLILAQKKYTDDNNYFDETYQRAKSLNKELK